MQQLDLLARSAPAAAPSKAAAPWSDAECERLTDLYLETCGDVRAIAARMGRTVTAIWTKASYLGLSIDGPDVKRQEVHVTSSRRAHLLALQG
ncbi:hypothetical protein SAMN05216338_1001874 [Bradyrhizobium sp. Rc2d]|uniref:hypothetical protein n=1 Tax=Bradyrhizobium sp. Rc2d TaxID=1855321 RepID=UPI000880C71B|nr:hypothetical protein [Bradyrhizobium sp. Rc2d]SDG60283.1 hypothetical protein SAMN05216338_1001874 [Bradyrhizobium sp. Rc2d]